jgi:hypothetical protein
MRRDEGYKRLNIIILVTLCATLTAGLTVGIMYTQYSQTGK